MLLALARRAFVAALLILSCLFSLAGPADAAGLNTFPYGQCTWWAAQLRPDLLGTVWGNAWQWADEARWGGYRTGDLPAVGAVAVLQPGVQGADQYGHVAYVQRVSGAWFQVSQQNWWPWPWQVTTGWFHTGYGVQFIYAR